MPAIQFTPVAPSAKGGPDTTPMALLEQHVLDKSGLLEARIRTSPLTDEELSRMIKCALCGENAAVKTKWPLGWLGSSAEASAEVCKYHNGQWVIEESQWACCAGRADAVGCCHNAEHSRPIPDTSHTKRQQYYRTPDPAEGSDTRAAVVVDCEMGVSIAKERVLLRVSVLDAKTRELLIDRYIQPEVKMFDFVSWITGITPQTMNHACSQDQCFQGHADARKAIWSFVGPNTLVMGHDIKHDLHVLKWTHLRILDTFMLAHQKNNLSKDEIEACIARENQIRDACLLEGDARLQAADEQDCATPGANPNSIQAIQEYSVSSAYVDMMRSGGRFPRKSLKKLTKQLLGRDIQEEGQPHCSNEDVLATLDIAIVLSGLPTVTQGFPEEDWVQENIDKYSRSTLSSSNASSNTASSLND